MPLYFSSNSSSSSSPGTVIGPGPGAGASTNNAFPRWANTTGTLLKDSPVICDDSGNITGVASLTVTTLIATQTITTGDNLIVLNDDVVGSPTEDAGIEINRGASTDARLLWDETNDYWKAGLAGSEARILLAGDDHGLLGGLGDDDHTQYHTDTRALTWLGTRSTSDLPEGSNLYFTDERVDDRVAALLVAGTGITLTYNDGANTLTIDGSALYTNEDAQDAVGSILTDTAEIDFTYNDAGNQITADLKTTGVSASSYGSATQVGTFTVDSKGRLTAASNTSIAIPSSAITDFTEATQDVVGAFLVDSSTIDFTYNDGGNSMAVAVIPGGIDHGALADLSADDHTQYALLVGRSGGQILRGGTASGDDLDLRSTSHATKGDILFDTIAKVNANKRLTVGDPTETNTFFLNDAQKFLVNPTITGLGEAVDTMIQIGACTTVDATPSGDTNSGALGYSLYIGQGFNLDLNGSNKFNGGVPLSGYPNAVSAIGAFGQVNIKTDDTVDGVFGLLCTVTHQGGGAAVSDMVGGVFAAISDVDSGTSGSINLATGGYFNVVIQEDAASITTGRSGWFVEPSVAGGSGTFTNKTACHIDGTVSITQTDSSSSGNIDAFDPVTSYNYMTGAAPVLRGMLSDAFNKIVVFDFANTATVTNESGSVGTAGYRITTGTGADLTNVKSVCLIYNTTTSRWRVQWWRT